MSKAAVMRRDCNHLLCLPALLRGVGAGEGLPLCEICSSGGRLRRLMWKVMKLRSSLDRRKE